MRTLVSIELSVKNVKKFSADMVYIIRSTSWAINCSVTAKFGFSTNRLSLDISLPSSAHTLFWNSNEVIP
jgi:hypothetical protein